MKTKTPSLDWSTTAVLVYLPSGRMIGPFKNAASIPKAVNALHEKLWAAYANEQIAQKP